MIKFKDLKPGFYEFTQHRGCHVLVERDGTVRYCDRGGLTVTHPNWGEDNKTNTSFTFIAVTPPKGFYFGKYKVPQAKGSLLLCVSPKSISQPTLTVSPS